MRKSCLALVASLAWPSGALAQFVQSPTPFEGVVGAFHELGVGAPAVTWHHRADRFVMFFETQTGAADGTCPDGYWSIGAAASEDGENWVMSPDPVIEPVADTYAGCGVRQPTVLRRGRNYLVMFKTLQQSDACEDGIPSWGCARDSGLSYTTLEGSWQTHVDGLQIVFTEPVHTAAPVIEGPGYDEPSLVLVGNTLHLFVAWFDDILHATSSGPDNWSVAATPALEPGFDSWALDQLYSPTVICADTAGSGTGPGLQSPRFQLYVGGRTWGVDGVEEAGFNDGTSINGSYFSMTLGSPPFIWSDLDSFVSLEAMNAGSRTLIWFEEIGLDGRPQIRFMDNGDWATSDLSPRNCR